MDTGRARGRARGRIDNDEGRRPGPQGDNGGAIPRNGGANSAAAGMAGLNINDGARSLGRGATRSGRSGKEIAFEMYDLVATRPQALTSKQGTSGNAIQLMSNYFAFKKKPDFKLYQYRVDFGLEEDRTFVKRAIVHRAKDQFPTYIFDGTIMLTIEPLYPHLQQQDRRIMCARKNGPDQPEEPCEIIIKLVGEIHKTDHHYIHFFNSILRRAMEGLKMQLLGRNYYDAGAAAMEPAFGLEVWPGYVTSIRQHEHQVLTCAEVSHKILRTETVLDQIRRLKQEMQRRNQSGDLLGIITRCLIGTIVITKYNRKSYRVDDVDWNQTPESTFGRKDGSQQSFANYYETRYGLKVKDPKQPLLVSMPKEKDRRGGRPEAVLLVPELCNLTGMDDAIRNNYQTMDALGKYTKMDPTNRVQSLLKLSKRLTSEPDSVKALKDWGMELDTTLVSLKGRSLPQEEIIVRGGKKSTYKIDNADWSNTIRSGCFSEMPITKWIFLYPKDQFNNVDNFFKCLTSAGVVTINAPKWMELMDTRTSTYLKHVREAVAMKPHMIVVVIPSENGDTYSSIKKLLCCECPVPSQVLTVKKVIGKPQKHLTFATKVLLQMTAKLGGTPWAVQIPITSLMVVGFDTYHDTANKGQSFGALVASLNNTCSRYFSTSSPHIPKAEMSSQIPVLFGQALRKYYEVNNEYPKRIFFYRDGVGEGQVKQVYDHELKKIHEQLATISGPEGKKPQLTFIIVSKRINTRFFTPVGPGKFMNPPSGTVVDDVVTLPERYDFYLISQSVKNGTVNPTSYNVILDESGLKPEHIQKLTYKLCHLYYNWTGTVRVPAPCQYAHKLAYLCGEALHAVPSNHFNEQGLLYFL